MDPQNGHLMPPGVCDQLAKSCVCGQGGVGVVVDKWGYYYIIIRCGTYHFLIYCLCVFGFGLFCCCWG
jgi:hypothetical protein